MIRIAQSLCAFLLLASATAAQDAPVRIDPGATESSEAYSQAVRWRRVHDAVQYFDPNGAAPSANLRLRERRAPTEPARSPVEDRTIGTALAVLVVAGVVLLVLRFGNFSTLGLGTGDPARRPAAGTGQDAEAEGPVSYDLRDILSMPDRAQAVHMLLAAALVRAAEEVDLYLHPSWTARDILRRIPASWTGRGALGDLTRVAEEVHFGGRTISEDEFDRVARGVVPLFRGGAA